MKLLSSPLRFNALSGFNLEVVEYVTADQITTEIIEVAMAIRRIEGLLHRKRRSLCDFSGSFQQFCC